LLLIFWYYASLFFEAVADKLLFLPQAKAIANLQKNAFPIAIGITKISSSKCETYYLSITDGAKINLFVIYQFLSIY